MRQPDTNCPGRYLVCFRFLRDFFERNKADQEFIGLGALFLPSANRSYRTLWLHQYRRYLPRRISLCIRWKRWNYHALGFERVEVPVLIEFKGSFGNASMQWWCLANTVILGLIWMQTVVLVIKFKIANTYGLICPSLQGSRHVLPSDIACAHSQHDITSSRETVSPLPSLSKQRS